MAKKGAGRRGNHEGSIRQRASGGWEARLTLPDGGRKSFYGKSRQDVARRLNAAIRDLEQGVAIVSDERLTVSAYLGQWLERMAPPRVRPSTHRGYIQALAHVTRAYGELRLTRLTARHLADLYARLQRPEPPQRALSSTTVHLVHVVLREALGDAVKLDLLATNVTDRVDAPRPSRPPITPLTADEARRLLEAAQGDRLEPLYILAIATGMRLGELLGLTWRRVNFDTGRVQVAATLQLGAGRQWELAKPKTKSSQRGIQLPAIAMEALRAHRARQLAERMAVADVWRDRDLVFCNEIGDFLSGVSIERYTYQRALTRAGLPHKRFHDLRHTAATLLLEQGVPLKTVSAMLGHSSIAITADVYGHLTRNMEQAPAGAMDALLRRSASGVS